MLSEPKLKIASPSGISSTHFSGDMSIAMVVLDLECSKLSLANFVLNSIHSIDFLLPLIFPSKADGSMFEL